MKAPRAPTTLFTPSHSAVGVLDSPPSFYESQVKLLLIGIKLQTGFLKTLDLIASSADILSIRDWRNQKNMGIKSPRQTGLDPVDKTQNRKRSSG